MTEYTVRLIIVVRANVIDNANLAAKLVDKIGGEFTFNVALARPANPTVTVAYWCNWCLKKAEAKSLKSFLLDHGFTAEELKEAIKNGYIVDPAKRAAIFRADTWLPKQDMTNVWSPSEVLSALNLQTIETEL